MWDQQYDDELSDAENSDEPDSDIEALLYSKVHYEAEEDEGGEATEAAQTSVATSLLTGDLASGLASAVAKGKAASKRQEHRNVEKLKGLEGVSAVKQRKKSKLQVIVEEGDGEDDSNAEDRGASPSDAIVLSSDDELIVFSEDSQNISLNVEGAPGTSKSKGDPWRVDVEDRYRITKGFRYHNQFSGVRCRNCNESGHLSKFCPQPRVKVCHLCAEPGHQGFHCPQRICARCYETGHALAECQQSYSDSCDICQAWGHPSRLCPDLWRRYHLTTEDGPIVRAPFKTRPMEERYCYNCAGRGHFGHQCHMKKRGNPGTPYIISYDDPHKPHQSRQSEGDWRAPPNKQKGGKGSRKRAHGENASASKRPKKRPRHDTNHHHYNDDEGEANNPSMSNGGGSKKKQKKKKSQLQRKIEASVASQMSNMQQLHAGKNRKRKKNANSNWRQEERPAWDYRGKYATYGSGHFPRGWRNSAY